MTMFSSRSRLAGFVLAGVVALSSALAGAAQGDLPTFPGDGRNTGRPAVAEIFAPAPAVPPPEEPRGDAGNDASLRRVLDTQVQVLAQGYPDQVHTFPGVPRTVTTRDLSRLVVALHEALDSGRPLADVAEAHLL